MGAEDKYDRGHCWWHRARFAVLMLAHAHAMPMLMHAPTHEDTREES